MEYKDYGVVLTGGAHGIGKAILEEFVNYGAQVCFIDSDMKRGSQIQSDQVHFYCGDISKQNDLDAFVDFCFRQLNHIDILVNNACVSKKGILSQCRYEDFQNVLSIGVVAPYYLSLSFQKELIQRKGQIINISSSRTFQSEPDTESYSSAKGGITALTHALAISLAPHVRVNCIAPGWINIEEQFSFEKEDENAIPVGRIGRVEDVAKMVSFLCSQDAGFITGETFVVDGGMSKRMIYHGDHGWQYHM